LNRKYTLIFLLFSLSQTIPGRAQKLDTVASYSLSGYIDAYYAYYTDSVGPGNFQKFPSISPRSNSPSLNTAQLSFQYSSDKIRTTTVLHFGDIANATWPRPYNAIMEAHLGFRLAKDMWLEGGFFRTHFGTEYLLPSENITSAVSVGTFYEPYYESGLRIDYFPIKRLEIALYLLNSYGTFIENNNKKSFGTNIAWAITDNLCLGYTNYIGDDTPPDDPITHLRIHQNAYINYQYKKFKLVAGADYCIQQHSDINDPSAKATMSSGLATLKYQWTNKAGIYGRVEFFSDPNALMSTKINDNAGKETGYKVTGASLGLEYKPTPESYVRLEGRKLQMDQDQYVFYHDNSFYNYRYEIMVNAGVSFDLLRGVRTKAAE
jgi:hypothetical protein